MNFKQVKAHSYSNLNSAMTIFFNSKNASVSVTGKIHERTKIVFKIVHNFYNKSSYSLSNNDKYNRN